MRVRSTVLNFRIVIECCYIPILVVHGYTAIKVVDRATGLSYFALAGTSVAETFGSSIAILENTMVVGASTCGNLRELMVSVFIHC